MRDRIRLIERLDRRVSLDEAYFAIRLKTKSGRKKLFYDGWGDQKCIEFVKNNWLVNGEVRGPSIRWNDEKELRNGLVQSSGQFVNEKFYDWLPVESRTVNVMRVRHAEIGKRMDGGVYIAPTSREMGFSRRMKLAVELAKKGFDCVMIDGPFMGARKPEYQYETVISRFSDYTLLAAVCIHESQLALAWMREQGMANICATGVSQGAYASSGAALGMSFPVKVISVVPPNNAREVVADGIPGRLCDWASLNATAPTKGDALKDMQDVFELTRLDGVALNNPEAHIHLIAACEDKFIPVSSYQALAGRWKKQGTVEWSQGGHVASILNHKRHLNRIVVALSP